MSDYKDTLNLPQTDFPMKGQFVAARTEILKKWQEWDIYQQLHAQDKA